MYLHVVVSLFWGSGWGQMGYHLLLLLNVLCKIATFSHDITK